MRSSLLLLSLFFLACLILLSFQHNKYPIKTKLLTTKQCIDQYPHNKLEVSSNSNKFLVSYIKNSPKNCANHMFPSIAVSIENLEMNGWIQIISTDSSDKAYKSFIDYGKDIFPFYTLENIFYDGPLWNYTANSLPLNFWKAHLYAVKINNNEITILDGIEWGFKLHKGLDPEFIEPHILTEVEYKNDLELMRVSIKEYTFYTK